MYNKYRAKKTTIDGITFDSKAEARRYAELKLLLRGKKINDLILQPKYELQAGFTHKGKKIQAINYIADFAYYECDTGAHVVEDVKGVKTKEFMIKQKLFLKKYPNIDFRIIS
jgi:hypothetical protein